jgi:hypothetical protein
MPLSCVSDEDLVGVYGYEEGDVRGVLVFYDYSFALLEESESHILSMITEIRRNSLPI